MFKTTAHVDPIALFPRHHIPQSPRESFLCTIKWWQRYYWIQKTNCIKESVLKVGWLSSWINIYHLVIQIFRWDSSGWNCKYSNRRGWGSVSRYKSSLIIKTNFPWLILYLLLWLLQIVHPTQWLWVISCRLCCNKCGGHKGLVLDLKSILIQHTHTALHE